MFMNFVQVLLLWLRWKTFVKPCHLFHMFWGNCTLTQTTTDLVCSKSSDGHYKFNTVNTCCTLYIWLYSNYRWPAWATSYIGIRVWYNAWIYSCSWYSHRPLEYSETYNCNAHVEQAMNVQSLSAYLVMQCCTQPGNKQGAAWSKLKNCIYS